VVWEGRSVRGVPIPISGRIQYERSQSKNTSKSTCFVQILSAKSISHIIKFQCIIKGQIRRPAFISIDQFDFNFSHILSFVY